MPKFLGACAWFCREKIGWHRIGVILSIAVLVFAVGVLYHLLRDIKIARVIDAIQATSLRDIGYAAVFVAAGYFTLTFYDLFALHSIGRRDIPYRVAALAAFTSYAVGHNVGASIFSTAAVRYRIYSSWGLDAAEVAKLCFIAGLTFWLGNAMVLGLGITYVPQAASAIDQLPPWINRGLAILTLTVLYSYIVWVWSSPRVIGRGQWQVRLPDGPLTLLQILIGIVDLSCCALAMYMLLPNEPHLGFVSLAVIFVSATMLGFASHAPGGLGVFDAAMLIALWQMDKEQLLAGLLLFRLLYYIVPFAVSLVILGVRELMLSLSSSPPGRSAVAPPAAKAPDHAGKKADVV
jgi:glycosyltransferase 2 family protein